MTRLYQSTDPMIEYVVQIKTNRGRQSLPARTAAEALEKADALLANGADVQVFSGHEGLIAIAELRNAAAVEGHSPSDGADAQ